MIRRHHHHHRCTHFLRTAAAGGADCGTEVRGGYDYRDASSDMLKDRSGEDLTFLVGEDELLGEVGEDADTVGAGFDHEVDAALLAFEIEIAVVIEDGGCDREHALESR